MDFDFIYLWPHDVTDLIFQNLNGSEVLNATLVSPEWNQFIQRSDVLDKVVVVPRNSDDKLSVNILMQSKRKYRHLRVEHGTEIAKEVVEIIANPYHKFNSIHIGNTEFVTSSHIEQIMMNTCESLEKLYIACLSFRYEDEQVESYDFPNLRKLELIHTPSALPHVNNYFASFQNLESLRLINGCDENFKELIQKSPKLKKLEIAGNFYDDYFFKDLASRMSSRLEEFIFNNILSSSKDDVNLKFFNDFFKSQSQTLKRFETDALIEPDEIQNAFKMKNFVELSVKGFHYNPELMRMEIENLRSSETPITPAKLMNFNVHYMDDILFELLALNAPNLKNLKVRRFEPIDVSNPAWFTKLESISIHFFNIELKERILRKTDDERSHFEKLVLDAIIESTNEIRPLIWLEVDPF